MRENKRRENCSCKNKRYAKINGFKVMHDVEFALVFYYLLNVSA